MSYFSPEAISQAKQMDLLTYLQAVEPGELVRLSGNTYCTKEHDSLKISNGKWHWFSRGIGGRSALDFLIKVRGYSFTRAVEAVLSMSGDSPQAVPIPEKKPAPPQNKVLLPARNETNYLVMRYLSDRGIDLDIIKHCIANGLLFESEGYHNAVFLGYDKENKVRYGSVRSTTSRYKGDLTGSSKRYSFRINGETDTVHVFESAMYRNMSPMT